MHEHLFEISLNRRILNYCCIKSMHLPIFSIFPPFHFSGKVGLNLCNILAAMLTDTAVLYRSISFPIYLDPTLFFSALFFLIQAALSGSGHILYD